MDSARRRRAQALFRVAAAMTTGERETFLETVCPDDPTVRDEVERLVDGRTSTEATVVEGARPGSGAGPGSGDRIGPYELGDVLGEGGMGVVYRARRHDPIELTVALKLVKPGVGSGSVLARFEEERRTLALMEHPNIARVIDAGTTETGQPYFVMEFVDGLPITAYCDERSLDLEARLELFTTLCEAVQHAHQKGIIHRDLKPSNVLVGERDGRPELKIIDFGIARAIDPESVGREQFTQMGVMIGTPEYMAPEQAAGRNDTLDTRTDVYALGVMLYELIVGRRPFDLRELREAGWQAIVERICETDPAAPSARLASLTGEESSQVADLRRTAPSRLSRDLRRDLDWIAMKALAKEQERRYPSASELAADVQRFLQQQPVLAGPPSAAYRARKFVRRHRVGVAVVAALAISITAGAIVSTIGFVRAVRAERAARFEADTSAQVIDFLVGLFRISDPGEARGNTITAREVLDRGVATIDEELAERPAVRARLLGVMGVVYRSLGLYDPAEPLLRQAVEDRVRQSGELDPDVAEALSALGGLYLQRRQIDEAKAVLERARTIQDATLPPDDVRRARVLNNLGLVARFERRNDDAEELYGESLRIREVEHGPESTELIGTLSNLAGVARARERDDEAIARYERALTIARAGLPPDHPTTARLLNNLATLHRLAGRPAEALPLLDDALPIAETVYGPTHPETVRILVNQAETLAALDDDEAALAAAERAIAAADEAGRDDAMRRQAEALRERLRKN